MVKNINLPIIIGFNIKAEADNFLEAAELIVPKLKCEDLDSMDGGANQHLFIFYTRKDKHYREMTKNYGSAVVDAPTVNDETIHFVGSGS